MAKTNKPPADGPDPEELAAENERLRQELAEFKRQKDSNQSERESAALRAQNDLLRERLRDAEAGSDVVPGSMLAADDDLPPPVPRVEKTFGEGPFLWKVRLYMADGKPDPSLPELRVRTRTEEAFEAARVFAESRGIISTDGQIKARRVKEDEPEPRPEPAAA